MTQIWSATSFPVSPPLMREVLIGVDDLGDRLWRMARQIHEWAEVAFEEVRSARVVREFLADEGLEVRDVPGGPTTSFIAQAGNRGPVVVLCAEYDALPKLGHACGHDLIAAAAAGAGSVLASLAQRAGLRVRVVGCPAEETGGGKALLLDAGAFDDAACVLLVHPGTSEQSDFSSLALSTVRACFEGAAGHPVRARQLPDASGACLLAEIALGLLRHRLPEGAAIPWARLDEPGRPSERVSCSVLSVEIRAHTREDLAQVKMQVEDCLYGAAQAGGCRVRIDRPEPEYLDFRGDPRLSQIWSAVLPLVGRVPGADPGPYAVTDLGNVSHRVPALHAVMTLGDGQVGPHDPAFADIGAGGQGRAWIIDAAAALSLTALVIAAFSSK